jgi:hypothetical protein
MSSNELNEILNKTRRTIDICLSVEQVKELVEQLRELESIKEEQQKNTINVYNLFYTL